MASFANLGGVADPRLGAEADAIGKGRHGSVAADIAPTGANDARRRNSVIYTDSSIQFEDYHYWAQRSREHEKGLSTENAGLAGIAKMVFGRGSHNKQKPVNVGVEPSGIDSIGHEMSEKSEKHGSDAVTPPASIGREDQYGIAESEWDQAQRAARTATWGSIFYLITTDILGPYNVPWAISQMGYGPGFALYTVFGGFAFYSGLQLWHQFVGLDSTRYPLRNYGDLAFRVYGNTARIGVNILQSFQFFLNVALIIESNGQGLAQMAAGVSGNGFLCFVVAEVIFMLLGFVLGQIRTLQRLSWLANIAVWLNVIVIIMTMVVTHTEPPNYAANLASYNIPKGPVVTSANWPEGSTLKTKINGLMNCVFAYGGATLFNELMAEMRRPMDFWKGFICAEIFIYCVYLIMGMVVYSAQGQFTYPVAYQGIPSSAYSYQTLGNAISFISGLIAALLYGNIGVKVFYAAVLRDVFHFPALDKKMGKYLWVAVTACILQFSYTFPPILKVGYNCQKDSILPDEEYDPATGSVQRKDHGVKRWMRGYMKKPFINTFDVLYSLGALGAAGLGIYAAVVIHAGLYYGKDSLKTRLCLQGKDLMYDYCKRSNVPHMNCGKWVVAQSEEQMGELQKVHDFAKSVDIPIRFVPKDEAKQREPDVRAEAGVLESPTTGIVDSHGFMQSLHGDFEEMGGDTALVSPVTRIKAPSAGESEWKLWTAAPGSTEPLPSSPTPQTPEQSGSEDDTFITAETIINSAGLYACDINNMILPPERHRTPFYAKGTYFSYSKSYPKPSTLVYPAPVPGQGGLGTHLTLDMSGRVRFGPDVEWVDSPTDLAPTSNRQRFEAALRDIKTYLPGIDTEAVALDYAGIRPKLGKLGAVGSGKGFQDFYIEKEEGFDGFVNLLGIESPGLTSSLAIAEEVHRMLYR
ncbi:hypothetical protein LTR36_004181 [Oleoguttula mirabilis]|uniref:L-2-hydroxyglutarate dehydrogenase, mitochondrial n=1 Tax=Oleoguttula mirabilis TaxID=1507867 RepID=A0AAV9JHB9_9PEZI|nr:hypothetical protein LTR36_004181 [Oleoguttula mirabilis]